MTKLNTLLLIAFLTLTGCTKSQLGSILIAADQKDNAGPAREALVNYLSDDYLIKLDQELKYFDWALSLLNTNDFRTHALQYPSAFDQLCPNITSTSKVVVDYRSATGLEVPIEVYQFGDAMAPVCSQYQKSKNENERIDILINSIEVIGRIAIAL